MIKDYAKTHVAQSVPQRGGLALIFLLLLMICLSLGVFFIFAKKHRPAHISQAHPPVDSHILPRKAAIQPVLKKEPAKTQSAGFNYDFYTMLPKNQALPQVSAPESHIAQHQYFLQIASSRNPIEIKRLQDNLRSVGINSTISTVISNHITWYRLESERYTQRSAVDEDLSRLHQMNLAPIIKE